MRDGPDIAGNHQTISYNEFNLGSRIETGTGSQAEVATLEYDASRQRVFSNVEADLTWYSGELFEAQKLASGGEVSTYYVFANGERIAQVTRARADSSQSFGAAITYLHHDRLGSLVATTDSSLTMKEFEYDVFGEPKQTLPVPYGYTGHRHEQALGLVDAGGRFYDPKFGIFLSADPIGPLSGSSTFGNRYAYAGYDPVNRTDPSGLSSEDDCPGGDCTGGSGGSGGTDVGKLIEDIGDAIDGDNGDGDTGNTTLTPLPVDRSSVKLTPQTREERMGKPPPSSYGASFGGFAPAPLTGTGSPSVGGTGMWPGGGGRGAIAGSESWVDRQTLTPEQRAAMEVGDAIVGNVLRAEGAGYLFGRGLVV